MQTKSKQNYEFITTRKTKLAVHDYLGGVFCSLWISVSLLPGGELSPVLTPIQILKIREDYL